MALLSLSTNQSRYGAMRFGFTPPAQDQLHMELNGDQGDINVPAECPSCHD